MRTLIFILFFYLYSSILFGQNKIYYINPGGNDVNNGLSIATAWKTITKVTGFAFQPGDQILFEGGQTFTGYLEFQSNDNGTSANPVHVSSYGTGKATINGNTNNGLFGYNVGGMEIHDLIFTGNGATANDKNGVEFYIDQATADIDYIAVEDVEVYGFGGRGILISGWNTTKGFNNVRIVNCSAHDNGRAGIETYGYYPNITHTNFYVGYSKAYRNYGRSDYTSNNSGNGILLSGIDGATIEYCEAYENGQNNGHYGGGPVGIWFYDLKNGVIQFSESHHNKAGLDADGAGFDIDGGCENCMIQYCYSHDNEGTGFGMFEFGSPNPFVNNTIRYNIGQNDGRKNSSGGLAFWGADASHKIINCEVYNNTIYVDNLGLTNGAPSALYFLGNNMQGLKIRNNIFYITSGVSMLRATSTFNTSAVLFQNNNYYATGTSSFLWAASTFPNLTTWKAAASGQEMNGVTSLGTTVNPMLLNPGSGGIIGPASGGNLNTLTSYHLQSASPLINSGLNLSTLSGINTGTRDYYNNITPANSTYDIGAYEFTSGTLPIYFTNVEGKITANQLSIKWEISADEQVESFVIEISEDGRTFKSIKENKAHGNSYQLEYSELIPGKFSKVSYCRIKAVTAAAGGSYYSGIIQLQIDENKKLFSVYPNPAAKQIFLQSSSPFKANKLVLRNVEGEKVLDKIILPGTSIVSVDVSRLKPGMYIGILTGGQGNEETFVFVKK